MILTVTPNPCVDKTVFINELKVGTFMRSEKYSCIPGGKGINVSRAIKTLGRDTMAMAIVGGHTGAHVIEMIERQDRVEPVPVWVQSPTRTITTVLEESVHRQTALFEPGSRVTAGETNMLLEIFQSALAEARIVTFNGTVPDPEIRHLYREMIGIAKSAGVLTILDSHGEEFRIGLESVPYMVKPNVAEARELVGFALDSPVERLTAIELLHELGVQLVVLSLGKDGAIFSRGGEQFHAVPPPIDEVNPVGSGDALVAGIAIGLLEQWPLVDAAKLGIAAGTANAMTWDIGHFDIEQIEELTSRVVIRPVI